MPRIFGVNLIAWLASAVALYFVGFIFYGLLFADLWVGLSGFTEAEIAAMEGAAPVGMVLGFVISLVTTLFLGIALKAFGATSMGAAMRKAVLLWAGFAVTTMAYDTVYGGEPLMLLVLDSAHLLVGFVAAAAVQVLLDGVGAKAPAAAE